MTFPDFTRHFSHVGYTEPTKCVKKKHGREMEEKTFSSIFKLPVNNKCLRDLWKMEEKNINKVTNGQVPLTRRKKPYKSLCPSPYWQSDGQQGK